MDEYYRLDRNISAIRTHLSGAEKRGRAEGKAETTREMVIRLHQQGVDKHIIATAAQVSLEEVESMLSVDHRT